MDEPKFCSKCGHEISAGSEFCTYCGTRVIHNNDPVASGARYEHIQVEDQDIDGKAIWEGNTPLSSSLSPKNLGRQAPYQMTCYKCGSLIPADSIYCPVCQVQLFVDCPKCGNRYSAQYPSCNKCGTNREAFLKRQKEQKEEAGDKAVKPHLEDNNKSQQVEDAKPNWLLILFILLFIAWLVVSAPEWLGVLFGINL